MANGEDGAAGIEGEISRSKLGIWGYAEGEDPTPATTGFGQNSPTRVIDIDNANLRYGPIAAVEQRGLRIKICG